MVRLDTDTIDHLARLCRLACTEEEKQALLKDLNQILGYVDRLTECDTDAIEPLSSVIQGQESLLLRDDVEEESLDREAFLRLAPQHVAGLIKVPNILE